jgi:hypothetical protein
MPERRHDFPIRPPVMPAVCSRSGSLIADVAQTSIADCPSSVGGLPRPGLQEGAAAEARGGKPAQFIFFDGMLEVEITLAPAAGEENSEASER